MAIPVLLILAVLWAAVLVPPVLRSRSESRRRGTVGDYSFNFSPDSRRRSRRSAGTSAGRSLHAVPQLGRRANGGRAGGGSSPIASGASAPMSRAQKRRRNVLFTLGCTAIATLLLALVVGSPFIWIANAMADLALVVYVILLALVARRGSLDAFQNDIDTWPPAPRVTTEPVDHPTVPPRRELAPLSAADSSLPRAAVR